MTYFVGAPPFIRVTLSNFVLYLLAYKKSAPLSDLASMLKVPLMDYTNPLYHCDFSTRWVEKESEIGLFFDLALCLIQGWFWLPFFSKSIFCKLETSRQCKNGE